MQPSGDLHLLPRLGTVAEALPRTEVSRSGAALPAEPLALRRPPHYGWSVGRLHVRELPLDLAVPAPPSATVADLAARMVLEATGWLVERDAPSCAPDSTVADAVRLMLERRARKLPVVEHGRCVGVLPLSVAAACEDPAVRGLLEGAVASPSLFARAWW
ncbi:MAG TPA: CBS domain-containing protein [Polyangia bacterium]|nr:CBS domain-containing protein [Polyangia bacterium]